jgi:hypothetical protein
MHALCPPAEVSTVLLFQQLSTALTSFVEMQVLRVLPPAR